MVDPIFGLNRRSKTVQLKWCMHYVRGCPWLAVDLQRTNPTFKSPRAKNNVPTGRHYVTHMNNFKGRCNYIYIFFDKQVGAIIKWNKFVYWSGDSDCILLSTLVAYHTRCGFMVGVFVLVLRDSDSSNNPHKTCVVHVI